MKSPPKPTAKPIPKPVPIPMSRQRPLMMQMGLAASSLGEAHFKNREKLDDSFWQRPAGKAVRASMEKVIDGLRRYQLHPYRRKLERQSVVWSSGQARLSWHAARTKKTKARILLLPSMINGAEILDILPGRSLLRWLTRQGFDVYLFEWGDLRLDPGLQDMDRAFETKIVPMLKFLQKEPDLPLFGIGYCMGGLFLAAAETLQPKAFTGLCFIATPWDFKAGAKGAFPEAVQAWAKDGLEKVRALTYMPADWLQLIFAGVDAGLIARKFSNFAAMNQRSKDASLFVAVEDWVNGGADLPAGILCDCVGDWYLGNKTMTESWVVAGQTVAAGKIKKPALVVVPGRDRIVPPDSARALAAQIPGAALIEPDCGHISMMVSERAEKTVWIPVRDWILSQMDVQSSKTIRRKPLKS